MSPALPTIPPDNPKRSLTLAQPDNLTHIGLVGDTYTIIVTGEQTDGRFCVIDMHIPPDGGPPPHRHDFEETFILLEGEMEATFCGKKSVGRPRWRHTEYSRQRSASVSQRFHPALSHALYLFSCETGEIFHGGWGTGRLAYEGSAHETECIIDCPRSIAVARYATKPALRFRHSRRELGRHC
jgi:hypothetical protein